MIQLYQFPHANAVRNISPYCLKVETFLRMAELPYEVVSVMNPMGAPKKKLPYIVDGEKTIADSEFILDYLIDRYSLNFEQRLSDQDKALGLCVVRTLDEHFIWTLMYSRWLDDRYWPEFKNLIFKKMPLPLRCIIPNKIRKNIRQAVLLQGMARHSTAEIESFAKKTLTAVSHLLADKTYLLGDQPTRYDASVYAFVANTLKLPMNTAVKAHAQQLKNLVDYCERMDQRYFSIQ